MTEYIRRGDALKIMRGAWSQLSGDDAMQEAIDSITHLLAADVRPVRHGRWGVKNECSECGCQPWFERDIHTLNFCPNCGADMREPPKEE